MTPLHVQVQRLINRFPDSPTSSKQSRKIQTLWQRWELTEVSAFPFLRRVLYQRDT